MRQRAEIFHFLKEQRSTIRTALAMKLLSHSEPNPLLFLQTWFRKPAGVSPIHHTLLVSSQRTEECVWPGCRNHQPPLAQEQLLRDPKEAGASRRSSSNGKTCKVIPPAPFPSACPLAYFCFSSSSRPQREFYFAEWTKAIPMSCSLPNTRALCSLQCSGPPGE